MIWILVAVALVAAALFLAHRALALWWPDAPAVSSGLVYAAAVVVAGQAVDATLLIRQATDRQFQSFGDDLQTQAILQTLSSHAADIAWQAGLVLAAAILVARAVPGRRAPTA